MNVLLDISRLHPGALKRGVGFYALNLFKALKELKGNNQYFLNKDKNDEFSFDLIHLPYFDPFFFTLPWPRKKPVVVTIHDLIPLKFSKNYPSGLRGKLKWLIQKRIVKSVSAIMTDSENSKKDIEDIIGFPKDKIFSIYLAASEEFRQLKEKEKLEKIRKKYSLPDNFIFYVGDLNWNKNVSLLVRALGEVKNRFNDINLVLAGSAFENESLAELKEIKRLIKDLKLKERVKLLGFVVIDDLVKIYNLARLYIQPSFYEGFGLPVLEAMQSGCPVLSSNKASLPEVGGQAVEYFNPQNKGELEKKIIDLWNNKSKLIGLSKKGLKQSKQFSWQKTAQETRRIYEKIIN